MTQRQKSRTRRLFVIRLHVKELLGLLLTRSLYSQKSIFEDV